MTGVPVLLLHGLSQQRRFWDPVIRRLRSEPAAAIDLRGHGDTDSPIEADYSVAACADDVAAALDTLGWQEAVVVGHSWGAAVALAAAARHPDRVRSVALIDGGLWPPFPAESRADLRRALTPPALGIDDNALWSLVRSGDLGGTWTDETADALRPTYVTGPDGLVRTRLGMDRHMKVLDGLLDHDASADLRALDAHGIPVWAAVCEPTDRPLNPVCDDLTRLRIHRWSGAVHDVPLQWPALAAGFVDALVESGEGSSR